MTEPVPSFYQTWKETKMVFCGRWAC